MDSAPGKATLEAFIAAFTADIKSSVTLFFMSIFLATAYTWIIVKDWVLGKESILDELKTWLVDGNAIDKNTKRICLYSDKDQLSQKESV